MEKLIHFLRGYLRIKVWGYSPERFMNLCGNRDILLWDIERHGTYYTMCISIRGFRELKPITGKTKTRVAILRRYGLPFFVPHMKKRSMFIVGLLGCLLFLHGMSHYIWAIEITGNTRLTTDVLMDFLEDMGLDFYKIASFELVDIPLIEYVASKGKPMILSTGMASLEEIREAVESIRKMGNGQIALLRCASAYPAVTDGMNLRTMQDMGEVFDVPVGLSDHSQGSVGAVTAVALGAKVVEKHFCLSREIENPDASFSMEPQEFKQMASDVRQAEKAIGTVRYGASEQEKGNIAFRKSLFVVQDMKAGDILTPENLRSIRPGYGIKPKYYQSVLGKPVNQDIPKGTPLSMEVIG